MIELKNEDDILNVEFRRQVIKDLIYCSENRERKAQMLRRHEIYKNKSKKWVMYAILLEQFKPKTVEQMRNRATNISIGKKIVNKLAQTYVGGVERLLGEPIEKDGKKIPGKDQMSMDALYDLLNFNTNMKKTDRYKTLFRNTMVGVVPVKDSYESRKAGKDLYSLQMQVLPAWKYDVLEDPCDKTKPGVVIISEFADRLQFETFDDALEGAQGRRTPNVLMNILSDGFDLVSGEPKDTVDDILKRTFIWWSGKYHFTTDSWGRIIGPKTPEDMANPIDKLPWVNACGDQDGNFWATGGEDIIEGDILINKKLTDCNFIEFTQGWGQLVIGAEEIPNKLEGGPDNAFIFQIRPEGKDPVVFYATSNPPTDKWLENVRTTLALLLSTNDLSTRHIASKLDVVNSPSGIAMLIDDADVLADVKDSQEYFRDIEPKLCEIVRDWHTKYRKEGWLTQEFQEVEPYTEKDVRLKFHEVKPPISEKDKLDELKARKEIGIATIPDLLKRDNPDLTDEEAHQKAEEILNEKKKLGALVAASSKEGQSNGIKNGDSNNPPDNGGSGSPPGERSQAGGPGNQEGGSNQDGDNAE